MEYYDHDRDAVQAEPFFFERKFYNSSYVTTRKEWINKNWWLSMVFASVYIVAVFLGQHYMKSREKFDLRRPLVAWNFVLCLFSVFGAARVWPEFYYTLANKGVEYSVCDSRYCNAGLVVGWSWLFALSKVPELIDTLFIVLRKQPLIFLHWYHHATVLIYCWYACSDSTASGRWFVIMNFTIHAVMYGYYGLRALRYNIPKWVNIMITSGQLSQMVFGIYINIVAFLKKQRGEDCDVSYDNIKWSFIMYFSYFLLFFKFFYTAYISPVKRSSASKSNQVPAAQSVNGGHAKPHQCSCPHDHTAHANGFSNGHSNGLSEHVNSNGYSDHKLINGKKRE